MADTRTVEIRRQVWDGQVGVCFETEGAEENVYPFYYWMGRCHYLVHCIGFLRHHFTEQGVTVDGHPDTTWFSYKDRPLPWHLPLGVLHDAWMQPSTIGDNLHIPTIKIHFSDYPTLSPAPATPTPHGLVSRIQYDGTRRIPLELYMGAIKQSAFLRHGNARRVMSLSKADTDQLYEALSTHDFDRFWQVNGQLVDDMAALQQCRSLPLRFYLDGQVIQRLVAPIDKSTKRWRTLKDALKEDLGIEEPVKAILHGMTLDSSTQLIPMLAVMMYPDNWCHIILRKDI